MKKNIKLVLQYDGTRYHGWQKQGNTELTIQGKLEKIFQEMTGQVTEVHGSGRTDEGVHALAQVANVHLETDLEPEEVMAYANRYLPDDIAVLEAAEVSERFHSRLNAVSKIYTYHIETGSKKDVFRRKYRYRLGKSLNVANMRKAASYLVGEHDFRSFCGNNKLKKSAVRTITSIEIEENGTVITIRYQGNGFLQQMIRILTGTLIEVGLGQREAQSMKALLDEKSRQAAGFTAPSEGLFLEQVFYS